MKEVFNALMVVIIIFAIVSIFTDAFSFYSKEKREKRRQEEELIRADKEETERLKKVFEDLKKNYN